STATATVKDSNGLPVPGQTVAFGTSGDVTFGAVIDHGDGTYTSTITSSLTADIETISANAGGKTGSAQLTESNIAASAIALTISPTSVRAGSTNTVTATAPV